MKPDIQALLTTPKELLSVEHKSWLDLKDANHRGVLAKALIALANHGGGRVVIGIREDGGDRRAEPRPDTIDRYTPEAIAGIVKKFADPAFECLLDFCVDSTTGAELAVVTVEGGLRDIVLSKSGIPNGPIQEFRPYIRKPGPSSEIPSSLTEWRALFDRCVKARQEELLDSIRAIVQGSSALPAATGPSERERQDAFVAAARARWERLTALFPKGSSATLPHGRWSVDLTLSGDFPPPDLAALRRHLEVASRVDHSGWPPFTFIRREPLAPKPVEGCVEAFLAESAGEEADHADFWRVSPEGRAYLIRGYIEDVRLLVE